MLKNIRVWLQHAIIPIRNNLKSATTKSLESRKIKVNIIYKWQALIWCHTAYGERAPGITHVQVVVVLDRIATQVASNNRATNSNVLNFRCWGPFFLKLLVVCVCVYERERERDNVCEISSQEKSQKSKECKVWNLCGGVHGSNKSVLTSIVLRIFICGLRLVGLCSCANGSQVIGSRWVCVCVCMCVGVCLSRDWAKWERETLSLLHKQAW